MWSELQINVKFCFVLFNFCFVLFLFFLALFVCLFVVVVFLFNFCLLICFALFNFVFLNENTIWQSVDALLEDVSVTAIIWCFDVKWYWPEEKDLSAFQIFRQSDTCNQVKHCTIYNHTLQTRLVSKKTDRYRNFTLVTYT